MGVLSTVGGAAAMMGAAGIGSSVLSNVTNKNIAQQNNAFNEKMLQKQMDYNTKMYNQQLGDTWAFYNDQKQYNSAEAQVQRLREAGLNPALAMQGQGGGSISSMTSPSAQGINPPSASQYSADYSGVAQSIANAIGVYNELQNSRSARAKMDAETEQVHIENKYQADLLAANLVKIKSETKSIDTKREIDAILKSFAPARQNAELSLLNAQTQSQLEQAKVSAVQALFTSKQLDWMDIEKRQQLAESAARISLMHQQGKLTRAQVAKEVQQTAESAVRTDYVHTQNRIANTEAYVSDKTKQNRISLVEQELWRAINNSGSDSFLQYFQNGRDNRTTTPSSGVYPLQPIR